VTIKTAGENWLKHARREGLEPTTVDAYDQHLRLHIVPFIGTKKLSQLTRPHVETFRNTLIDNGRSRDMANRVIGSLVSLIGEAERLGHVAKNVAKGVRRRRNEREKPQPIIPTKDELRLLIETAERARSADKAMMMVLIFAGLRASELRALPWRNINLKAKTITIDQRADRSNVIGAPKSASGRRIIPIPDQAVSELRRWRLQCPPNPLDLVFPSDAGTPLFHPNIVTNFLEPIQIAAGISQQRSANGTPMVDEQGHPVLEGRYTLHCLRHAAASLWIDQRMPPKRVQTWMGHHSIQVTFDTYGHLFAALEDDEAKLTAAAADLLSR
jgi:integrase